MERRSFLKGGTTALAGAAVAIPAKAGISSDERIKSAIEEIKAALQEKYPDWDICANKPEIGTAKRQYCDGFKSRNISEGISIVAHEKRAERYKFRLFRFNDSDI